MAKRKLSSITIRPGKNGGHTVRHEYQPEMQHTKGMNGGLSMSAPQSEEHTFGPGDHGGMIKHLAAALALKGLQQQASPLSRARSPQDQEQEI